MRKACNAVLLVALTACSTTTVGKPLPHAPRAVVSEEPERSEFACSRAITSAPSLSAVVLRGTGQSDACKFLQSRAGALVDDAKIEADIRALHATGLFADVSAVLEDDDDAPPVLAFEVKERPRVGNVAVRGAPEGFDARAVIGATPALCDPVWVRTTRQRLVQKLRDAGYRKAEVGRDVAPSADQVVAVSFTIAPGARIVLGSVRFEGLSTVPAEELRARLGLTPGEPAPEPLIERDTLVVSHALYDHGLVQAEVAMRIEENFLASRLDVVFAVKEGPAYRFGEVKVSGSDLLPRGRYAKHLATLPRGTLFVRAKVVEVVQTVERMHHDAGTDRRVDVRSNLDPKRLTVDLDIHVE